MQFGIIDPCGAHLNESSELCQERLEDHQRGIQTRKSNKDKPYNDHAKEEWQNYKQLPRYIGSGNFLLLEQIHQS